jgi:hypothetical protein
MPLPLLLSYGAATPGAASILGLAMPRSVRQSDRCDSSSDTP